MRVLKIFIALFLLLSVLTTLAACTEPIDRQKQISEERIREQAFIQDILNENTDLRNEKNELEQVLRENKALIMMQNSSLSKFLEDIERSPQETPHPYARISIEEIFVYPDKVIINLSDAIPVMLSDTNSMDPIADADSKVLAIAPQSERDIHLGDIVGYRCSTCGESIIMHRVVAVGRDAEGAFYIMKGDNNPTTDPDRVRFHQIVTVVIGIIY